MAENKPNKKYESRIRTKFRVERNFCLENNALDSKDGPFSRSDVREAVDRLTRYERATLQSRLRSRLERLNELMDGNSKQFDSAEIEHADLVEGVRIPGYWD